MVSEKQRTIGQLAEAGGVHVETIRYYERRGILQQPPKPESGWRTYGEDSLETLRFVKRAQRLGFSLDEIEELLALRRRQGPEACEEVRTRMNRKLEETERRLRELQEVRGALDRLAGLCETAEGRCEALRELGRDEPS